MYQFYCPVPPVNNVCSSPLWVPVSDLSLVSNADANILALFILSGFLVAVSFRIAIRFLFNKL